MEDDWTFVARKTRKRRQVTANPRNSMPCRNTCLVDVVFDENKLQMHCNKVREALKGLKKNGYAQRFVEAVLSAVNLHVDKKSYLYELVCYGLGNVCSSYIARYQFAMLLILWDSLKKEAYDGCPLKCVVYDPAFNNLDIAILKDFGISVLAENEDGRRNVDSSPEFKYSLFYMIHCDKFLYDNLLLHNMANNKISRLVIIGNSFDMMKERLPQRILMKEYKAIHRVLYGGLVCESPLPNWKDMDEIFNDTSIHLFKDTKLTSLKSDETDVSLS